MLSAFQAQQNDTNSFLRPHRPTSFPFPQTVNIRAKQLRNYTFFCEETSLCKYLIVFNLGQTLKLSTEQKMSLRSYFAETLITMVLPGTDIFKVYSINCFVTILYLSIGPKLMTCTLCLAVFLHGSQVSTSKNVNKSPL